MHRRPVPPAAVLAWAAVAAGVALYVTQSWSLQQELRYGFIIDDAYISLRHAYNFVQGYGFNYNTDGRIEGYTNFLWTLLMAVPLLLGLPPEPVIQGMGVASGAALIVAVFLLVRRLCGTPAAALAALALGLDQRLAAFSTWGLEVTFYPMLYAFGFVALFRDRLAPAAVLFGLAAMARMEGVLPAGVAGLYLLWADWPRGAALPPAARLRAWLARPLVFAAVFLGVFGTYFAARWAYYGQLLPNTFYAKVGTPWDSAARGLAYLDSMLSRMGLLSLSLTALALAALVAGAALLAPRRDADPVRGRQRAAVIGAALLFMAYVVSVGGDHFFERFVYHALPVFLAALLVPFAAAAGRLAPRGPAAPLAGAAAALAVLVALAVNPHRSAPGQPLSGRASLGLWLRHNAPADAVLATEAAGALPYFSRLRTIDMLGLNDLHIAHKHVPTMGRGNVAHEKSDPRYVLDRRPDYISSVADPFGGMGWQLDRHFAYRAAYDLVAAVNMTGRTLDTGRVHLLPPDAGEAGAAALFGRLGGSRWVLAKRRGAPSDTVELAPRDLRPGPFARAPGSPPGDLAAAPAGERPGPLIDGHGLFFPEGGFAWTLDLRFAGPGPALGRACVLEAVRRGPDGERVVAAAEAGRPPEPGAAVLEVRFPVAAGDAEASFAPRLYCDGTAGVRVTYARARRTEAGS